MAILAAEADGQSSWENRDLSAEGAAALGQVGLAEVIAFPSGEAPAEQRPGMEATMAFVNWVRDNDARGYGKFGVAEFKRDDGGLYVDHHGPKVYLTY
jgi:hypothetical protein